MCALHLFFLLTNDQYEYSTPPKHIAAKLISVRIQTCKKKFTQNETLAKTNGVQSSFQSIFGHMICLVLQRKLATQEMFDADQIGTTDEKY